MVSNTIERYLYDILNSRATLADSQFCDRHGLAQRIIDDVINYFVDHPEDVERARRAIAMRRDPEGRRMTALIDEFMSHSATASDHTIAALTRARRHQPGCWPASFILGW